MNIKNIFSLEGLAAVVTGGAGHLGSSICEAVASSGAKVAVADIDIEKAGNTAERLSGEYGKECIAVELDISSSESISKAMKKVSDTFGCINILVNNAYFGSMGTIEDMPESDWDKGMDGTAGGVFRCTQAVLPFMKDDGASSIINIASMYGMVSPDPGIYGDSGLNNPPNYGAGKAAIIQFTRYAACHLSARNIRVNSISPGAFPNGDACENKEFISKLECKIPLGRIGSPEELKGVILFLSSGASSYVTGVNIPVDGGWTAW